MSDPTPPQPEPEGPNGQPQPRETPANSDPAAPTEPSNPSAPEPSTPSTPSAPPQAPSEPSVPPVPPAAATRPGDASTQPAAGHTQPAAATAQPASASTQPPVGSAPHPAPGEPKPEKRNGNVGIIAALAIGALVGGVSGAGVYAIATNNGDSESTTLSPSATNITVNDPGNATTITAVAAQAAQSVVTISVRGEGASGSGSGVFLSDDGYILTNAHVATLSGATADPAVSVRTSDGHLHEATLVGSDPIADLAVVKVDAEGVEFKPAKFADSSDLNVGDTVVALGAPLGLPNTVTSGIVSALNRSITVASSAVPDTEDSALPPEDDGNDNNGPFDFWEFDSDNDRPAPTATIALPVIQTDAAINPGNSGGALLDSDGNVIGVNVAIASAGGSQEMAGNIGLGFAIPSNLAQRVAQELIEDGTASHGLLGASVLSVTDDREASQSSAVVGSVIKEITPGGAADEAGIRPGDVVVEFNGMPITSSTDLTAQVRVLPGGADAELVYVRDGTTETVTVTLGEL